MWLCRGTLHSQQGQATVTETTWRLPRDISEKEPASRAAPAQPQPAGPSSGERDGCLAHPRSRGGARLLLIPNTINYTNNSDNVLQRGALPRFTASFHRAAWQNRRRNLKFPRDGVLAWNWKAVNEKVGEKCCNGVAVASQATCLPPPHTATHPPCLHRENLGF